MSLDKGTDLERKAALFLWQKGYLPLINVKVKVENKLIQEKSEYSDITDLDVLGFNFGALFEKRSFFIDCKQSNVSKPFNHIINRFGIYKLLDINEMLILRSRVSEIIQNFCTENEIKVLNSKTFEDSLNNDSIGIGNITSNIIRIDIVKDMNKDEKLILNDIYNQLLDKNYYNRIKKLIRINNEMYNLINISKITQKGYRYLTFLLFELVEITIGDIASEVFFLWSRHHFNKILSGKFMGDTELKNKVYKIITKLESMESKDKNQTFPVDSDFLPEFFNSLRKLLLQIQKNPEQYQRLLLYNNLIIHEFGYNQKTYDIKFVKNHFGSFNRDLFANWNIIILTIIYGKLKRPEFIVKLLS